MTAVTGPSLDRLAVVVVSYGSHGLLESGLAEVAAALSPALTVVVDSLTTTAERARVRALGAEHGWLVVSPDRNTGFGAGCNLGVATARRAGATRFLLLNPDATITRRSVELLHEQVDADPLTLAAPTVLRPDGSVWSAGVDLDLDRGDMRAWRHRASSPAMRTIPWVTGACLLVDEALWDAVGGFDEEYFLYWEDVDLSARVAAVGGTVAVVPGATAVHAEGGTQGTTSGVRAKSTTYYYFNIRNRLLFAAKHLAPEDVRRWRRTSLGASYRILLRGGRRQLLRPAPWWAAWRGLRDGRRRGAA